MELRFLKDFMDLHWLKWLHQNDSLCFVSNHYRWAVASRTCGLGGESRQSEGLVCPSKVYICLKIQHFIWVLVVRIKDKFKSCPLSLSPWLWGFMCFYQLFTNFYLLVNWYFVKNTKKTYMSLFAMYSNIMTQCGSYLIV